MTGKLAPIPAAVLPPLFISLLGYITHQVDIRTQHLFTIWPQLIWALVFGLLCVLFLCLMNRLLPQGAPGALLIVSLLAGVLLSLACVWFFLVHGGWTCIHLESAALAAGIWLGNVITYLIRALRRSKA